MEKTFENMDKLKSELFEAIDKICKDYETKQTPEFKVPGWYANGNNNVIFYAVRLDGQWFTAKDDNTSYNSTYSRPATSAEIESHLKKICDKKGFKDGVKYHYPDRPDLSPRIFKSPLRLSVNNDYLYDTYNRIIWEADRGFAEIIPDKRKKPETKEERKKFMDELMSKLPDDTLALIYEFLDQYDI